MKDYSYIEDEEEFENALDKEDEINPKLVKDETFKGGPVMKYRKFLKDENSKPIFSEFVFVTEVKLADKVFVIDCNYNYGLKKDYYPYLLNIMKTGLKSMTLKLASGPLFEQILYNFIRYSKADPIPPGGLKGLGEKTQSFFPKDKIVIVIENFCDYLQHVDPQMTTNLRDDIGTKKGRDKFLSLYKKLATELSVDKFRLVATLSEIQRNHGEILNERVIRRKFELGDMPFGVEDTNCQEFSKVIKVKPRLFDALKSKKVVKVVDSNIFKVCSNVNSKTHTAIYRAESETDAIKAYILQALEAKLNVELCSVTASPIELVDALIYWENL